MNAPGLNVKWNVVAGLAGRLILAAVFLMSASFKLIDFRGTADVIALAGFPFAEGQTCAAAALEFAIVISLATRKALAPTALVAAAYVLFLGITFHGPSTWAETHLEFVIFIDHFIFIAGLLLAASSASIPSSAHQAAT
jgi:uncharacterized membrane protein YphA (DoxX/SURF4 family)